jgi:hypothetical protein
MKRALRESVAVLSIMTVAGPAFADPPVRPATSSPRPVSSADAPAPSSANLAAQDVVMLKNGGILRGTISELIPDDTVTILTVSGATRQISMAQVRYAGPREQAPPLEESSDEAAPAKPAKPNERRAYSASGEDVPISFVTREKGDITLYIKTQGYTRVCTAPCEAFLPPGAQQLALAIGTQGPVPLADLTHLGGRSQLVGSYESHKEARRMGWSLFGASLGIGALVFAGSVVVSAKSCPEGGCSVPTIGWLGLALGGLGAAAGLGLALRFDEVDLKVRPE